MLARLDGDDSGMKQLQSLQQRRCSLDGGKGMGTESLGRPGRERRRREEGVYFFVFPFLIQVKKHD